MLAPVDLYRYVDFFNAVMCTATQIFVVPDPSVIVTSEHGFGDTRYRSSQGAAVRGGDEIFREVTNLSFRTARQFITTQTCDEFYIEKDL